MSGGLLSLKWNHHRSTFLHILRDIKEKDQFSDVILACEGKFYNAHKLVLATCSEYFENMFQQTQCKQPVIVLKDISRIELEALLSYMYDGEVNVLQENLATLIKAAECLKIKGLAVADEDPAKSELVSSKRKQLSNDTSTKDHSYRYSSKDSNSERNSRNKRSLNNCEDTSSKENLSKKRKESSTSDSEDAVNDNNLDASDISNVTYQNHDENVKQEPIELSDQDEKLVISQSLEALSNSVQNNNDDSEFRSDKNNSLNTNENRSNDSTANEIIEGKYIDRDDGADATPSEISSLWLNNEIDDSLTQQAGTSRYNDHSHQLHPGTNKSDSESMLDRAAGNRRNLPESSAKKIKAPRNQNKEFRSSVHEDDDVVMTDLITNSCHVFREPEENNVIDSSSEGDLFTYGDMFPHSEFFQQQVTTSTESSHPTYEQLNSLASFIFPTTNQSVENLSKTRFYDGLYHCPKCEISTPSIDDFRLHLECYRDINSNQCPFCPYSSARRDNLLTHFRRHTGDRPFRCSLCSQSFSGKSDLTVHTRKHTGKPFRCGICNFRGFRRTDVRLHCGTKHPDDESAVHRIVKDHT